MIKKISVFCGSSYGKDIIYTEKAKELAKLFSEQSFSMVYGGANIGLMEIMANTLLSKGGEVIGIMPEFLIEKEIAHQSITKLIHVDTMHERKELMAKESDAFIALPGGYGTMDEIMEMICMGQLQFHRKPCAFLNTKGFYNHLEDFFNNAVREGFICPEYKEMLIIESEPKLLIEKIMHYSHPVVDKAKRAIAQKNKE